MKKSPCELPYTFTPKDFIEFRKEAEMLIQKIISRLKQEGYLS
jgi:hypothetical protein